MEVECKTSPPPKAEAVLHGPLLRLSRASGRFFMFSAFLHMNPSSGGGVCGSLYLIDANNSPFSVIIITGPDDTITDSVKGPNAFSIAGRQGGKTILQAPTRAEKEEWVRALSAVARGESAATCSLPPRAVVEIALPEAAVAMPLEKSEVITPVVKGLLLKKGQRTGQYVRRWFELVPGVGLLHAAYGDSPREEFRQLSLRGLRVTFDESKKRIVIPVSGIPPRAMVLRCARAAEFVVWRRAISEECAVVATPAASARQSLVNCAGEAHKEQSLESGSTCELPLADPMQLNAESRLELEDLQSDAPRHLPPELLRSVGVIYRPTKRTPGTDAELRQYFSQCFPYGLEATLRRLRQRLVMPITEPYEAVNEHMVLLDLDVQRVRECLAGTLTLYSDEMDARDAIREMDFTLRVHALVRERLLVRLEIAAFREQPNQAGLPLGVNGTIKVVNSLDFDGKVSLAPEEAAIMWKGLYNTLLVFRLEFDIFDESEETIVIIENALHTLYDWLQQSRVDPDDLR